VWLRRLADGGPEYGTADLVKADSEASTSATTSERWVERPALHTSGGHGGG
jgi:hypothetical protein